MKKRNTIIVMLLSVIALTSCLDTLKQYCFHMYPNDYEYNDDYHYVICKICKDEKKEEHEFDEPYIVEYPTEDKKGLQEYYCIHCPYTKTEEIDKLVHQHSYDWNFTYENHWKEAKCGCDLEYQEYGPHTSDYEYETYQYKVQDATCMNGSKYFYTCRCGWHTLETFEFDDKLDHKFTNYESNPDGSKVAYCDYGCGTTDVIGGSTHVHVFNIKDDMASHFAADANCQHGLLFYYSCECDANGTETFEVSTKLEHKYINYIYNNDATEYEDGTETASCEYGCGETHTRIKEDSALGHIHVYDQKIESWETWAAGGDCQHGTIFFKSCICGEIGTETFDDGKPQPHHFTSYHYNNDATEYEDGTETASCEYGCGTTDTRVKEGSALGHIHVYDQKIEGTFYWVDGVTCQHGIIYKYSCICGEAGTETWEYGDVTDHYFYVYVYNYDATETEDGTETAYCEYGCGTTDTRVIVGSSTGHIHIYDQKIESWETWAAGGDCQHGTIFFKSCSCGEIGTETFDDGKPQPHNFTSYYYNNDATEYEDGTETAFCTYGCGTTDTRVKEGTCLSHKHVFNVKDGNLTNFKEGPTCYRGSIWYYVCVCGERGTEDDTYIDDNVLDHYFENYIYNGDATEEANGTETAYCKYGCGITDTREKPNSQLGHVHVFNVKDGSLTNYKEGPTCYRGSIWYYVCVCGERGTEADTYIDDNVLDHYFENYIYNDDATETEDGTETAYCKYGCGTTDTRVKPNTQFGHVHVFNIKDGSLTNFKEGPTCYRGSIWYYVCKCGERGTEADTYTDDNILDHDFREYNYTPNGQLLSYCEYDCGMMSLNGQLHTHEFNETQLWDYLFAVDATCQHGDYYYYSCVCGEKGTETFETGNKEPHKFFNYVYDNNATTEADGTETAYCYYGCGTTDTRVKEGTCLGHKHEFNLKEMWDYLFAANENCEHGRLFYYSCECGEKGTETFEYGEPKQHVFFDYFYDNNATMTEDGTETAYCYYGCGTTDTRVKEGTCLGHEHIFNVENIGDYYVAESRNCNHGTLYYYSCECGEKGTETFEMGEPTPHYYTISYIWLNDNTKVKGVATCTENCGYEITEEVETDITINYQPKTTQAGSGTYVTRPFENGIFITQYKQFEIKQISLVNDGNSVYGRTYFEGFENDGYVSFYNKMYQLSADFYESTEDLESSLDGLYVLGIIDAVEYGLSIEEAFSVWSIFYTENPVFYFLSNYVYSMGDSLILCVDPSYVTFEYRDQCKLAISEMVNKCGEFIGNSTEELVIARAIHDYIILNMDYAYENDGQTPQDDIWAHNIVGISLYNFGVCETYAKTYLMLCLIFGLDCIIVTGDAGGAHAWNYVNINGGWYGVDCTWDDAGEWGIAEGYFADNDNITSGRTPYGNSVFGINYLYDLPELSNINVL